MISRSIDWPGNCSTLALFFSSNDAWFWLDGEAPEIGQQTGRSYVGCGQRVVQANIGDEAEFFNSLRSECATEEESEIPTWVVALSYELGVSLLGAEPNPDEVSAGFAIQVETVVTLDHASKSATVHAVDEHALSKWLSEYQQFTASLAVDVDNKSRFRPATPQTRHADPHSEVHRQAELVKPSWRDTPEQYRRHVDQCRDAIREGEAYVLCLTDIAQLKLQRVDPLELFSQLRGSQPAIRGAVIVTSDRALISASPERFLSLRNGRISTTPMKGTRPRGSNASEDETLIRELAHDRKEIAENLMIVDLMRNDFSKICAPGTVRTDRFLEVETHPRVHQLVSTVTGQLNEHHDVFTALEACFPGGSMTGAPKKRAVELLANIEQQPRGLYSGCFGWIGSVRTAELAMSIRCIELRDLGEHHQLARVGAGGGITIDSVASSEFEEKEYKAQQLLSALTERESGILEGFMLN